MKILITGGNGYIGARLSQFLSLKGNQVIPVCFPRAPENEDWKKQMYEILVGDIREEETLSQIEEINPDAIIHLVSLDHFDSEKEPEFVASINVLPTWRLLDKFTKKDLKKFIYFSTIQVYGKLPMEIIDESFPANTQNAYAMTHFLSEGICDYYNRKTKTDIITIRLSNSYGYPVFADNNCWWLAINDLCRGAIVNREIRLISDGTPQRDFIHGNDVCKAVALLLHANMKSSDNVYHVSSGKTMSLMEIAKTIQLEYQKRYRRSIPILTSEGAVNKLVSIPQPAHFTIDNQRIKALGFKPDWSLTKGINELFNYLEKSV